MARATDIPAVVENVHDIVKSFGQIAAPAIAEEKCEDVDIDEGVYLMTRIIEVGLRRTASAHAVILVVRMAPHQEKSLVGLILEHLIHDSRN